MSPSCVGEGLTTLDGVGVGAFEDVAVVLVGSGLRVTSTQYELPTLMPLQSLFTNGFCPLLALSSLLHGSVTYPSNESSMRYTPVVLEGLAVVVFGVRLVVVRAILVSV